MNSPRGASFQGESLTVSSIYAWYQADFGGTPAGVIRHLRQYADPALTARLRGREGYDDHDYDCSLNAVP